MKKTRRGNTYLELCVFLGCFLLVFVSVAQILIFSHKPRTDTTRNIVTHSASSNTILSMPAWSVNNNAEKKLPRNLHVEKVSSNMPHLAGIHTKMRDRTRGQQEVRQLERALAKLMRENTVTLDEANARFRTEHNYRRIDQIIKEASSYGVVPHNVNGSRLRPAKQRLLLLQQGLAEDNHLGSFSEGWEDLSQNTSNGVFQNNNHTDLLQNPVPSLSSSINNNNGTDSRRLSESSRLLDIMKKRKSRPESLHRFKQFNRSDELELKSILRVGAPSVNEFYKEEDWLFEEIKRAQQEGRELFVDEEALMSQGDLLVCPRVPDTLVGNISSMVNLSQNVEISEVLENNTDVHEGGEWKPPFCVARYRVAIIVPYRDRWSHLKVLLYHLIPMLKRQQIHFRIFVVEQYGNDTFNKGRIMNSAFREAIKLFDFQCVTFHDVDLVPEDDRNMYSCTEQPKHMSIAIDKFLYVLPYQGLVGGVLSFQTSHFQLVNGYSNMYWGWGAEDDDMTTRILHRGLRIYRPPTNIARYKMVKHDQRKISEMSVRMKLLRSAARRSKLEGLNNVQYKLLFTHTERLFTHFMVDIGHQ